MSDPERLADELMVERLERLERDATPGPWRWEGLGDHGYPQRVYGRNADPSDGTYPVVVMESYWGDADTPPPDTELIVAMRNALPALLSQLREQRDRTSFWETLHDERVESLETERDKALKMRDYWYAEFKRTVDPVNNPHRCSSECADNPTCPVIRAYDQDATDG